MRSWTVRLPDCGAVSSDPEMAGALSRKRSAYESSVGATASLGGFRPFTFRSLRVVSMDLAVH
jgi:hypothetical protein